MIRVTLNLADEEVPAVCRRLASLLARGELSTWERRGLAYVSGTIRHEHAWATGRVAELTR